LIRMGQRFSGPQSSNDKRKALPIGWWTTEEHDKFLEAMALYPSGPWKKIARHVGTRTPRQAMTHAQKYRQRIKRRANLKRRRETESKASLATQTESSVDKKSTSDTPRDVAELAPSSASPQVDLVELLLCEVYEQIGNEFSPADLMLLDEVLEDSHPNDNDGVPVDPLSFLDDEELVQILRDPSLDCAGLESVGAGLHLQ
jgi:SHAQKYF class myb-like DNA-binding protein